MAPETKPRSEGLPFAPHSTNSQERPAAAVATKVLIIASAAVPLASRLEPALKPNQPTQSSAAPIIVMVSECGAIRSRPYPTRLPMRSVPTRPAMPALSVPRSRRRSRGRLTGRRDRHPRAPRRDPPERSAAGSAASATALAALPITSGPPQYQTMWAIGK